MPRYTLTPRPHGFRLEGRPLSPPDAAPFGTREDWLAIADAMESGAAVEVERPTLALVWWGATWLLVDPKAKPTVLDAFPVTASEFHEFAAYVRRVVS